MEQQPPPPPPPVGGDYEPAPMPPDPESVKSQLMAPGIGLIIVSTISLLWLIIGLTLGGDQSQMVEQMMEEMRRSSAEQGTEIDMAMVESMVQWLIMLNIPITILQFLTLSLSLAAGINMIKLRAWNLSVAGSIVAVIPCLNGNCCCVAIPLGIWALVVLNKDHVKQLFN